MSAVHLHNALYNQAGAETRQNSRHQSTLSSVTLQTDVTLHSQPHEPLLPHNHHNSPPRASYYDILSRNPRPDATLVGHDRTFEDKTMAEKELLSTLRRRRLSGMRKLKIGLDALIGVWALYTAVRYFLAFTVYDSTSGETVSLVLGTCSGLSFAFLSCAVAVSTFRPQLLRSGISYGTISTLYWCLTYISLLLMFAPAAVNLAFVFVWRDAGDLQLSPKHRCAVDVDLVWAKTTHRMCKRNTVPWGVWVALSSLRLALTSVVLLGYQYVLYRLSKSPDVLAQRFRGRHRVNPSDFYPHGYRHDQSSVLPPHLQQSTSSGVPFPPAPSSMIQSQPRLQSQSSLSSRTKFSTTHRQLSKSRSSGLSGGGGMGAESVLNQGGPVASSSTLAVVPEGQGGEGIGGFSDQFSKLVSEIEQETEDALKFARSDEAGQEGSVRSSKRDEDLSSIEQEEEYVRRQLHSDDGHENNDDEDDFYGGGSGGTARTSLSTTGSGGGGLGMHLPSLGYNEFGQPYPPEVDVPMMNGYIRRMPTIESMGSREIGSSIGGGSSLLGGSGSFRGFNADPNDRRASVQTAMSHSLSRPGTRSGARASWGGGERVWSGDGE